MNYIDRNFSVITGKANLEPLFTFKNFPVFIGCTQDPLSTDLLADLSFSIDPETGVIQLNRVLPLDVVYSQYHSEALGKMWTDHHLAFINFIALFSPKKILEIGGSNGFMGNQYLSQIKDASWTIIEPNPSPDISPAIKVIKNNFDAESAKSVTDIDTIVHSHVFEHMYYPKDFIALISDTLAEGQYQFFSIPNLLEWLKSKFTNCLNFEHTVFLTEYLVDYLLSLYGFEILKKQHFNNHSIFYATKKTKPYNFNFISQHDSYLQLFTEYTKFLEDKVISYNQQLPNFPGPVYLFGAHVFSQVLLNLGLKSSKIINILDNSQIKQDKRLYGYKLIVKSPDVIKNDQKPVVILNAGTYQQEIASQLKELNPQVRLIT